MSTLESSLPRTSRTTLCHHMIHSSPIKDTGHMFLFSLLGPAEKKITSCFRKFPPPKTPQSARLPDPTVTLSRENVPVIGEGQEVVAPNHSQREFKDVQSQICDGNNQGPTVSTMLFYSHQPSTSSTINQPSAHCRSLSPKHIPRSFNRCVCTVSWLQPFVFTSCDSVWPLV